MFFVFSKPIVMNLRPTTKRLRLLRLQTNELAIHLCIFNKNTRRPEIVIGPFVNGRSECTCHMFRSLSVIFQDRNISYLRIDQSFINIYDESETKE